MLFVLAASPHVQGSSLVRLLSVFTFASAFLLGGCAVHKDLVPTSGNRAGGTVTLSYEYGWLQRPVINPDQGEAEAQQRCNAWGYSGAEPFGGGLVTCEDSNGDGECLRKRVDITYQCTGNPK